MALNDFIVYDEGTVLPGAQKYAVAASATLIKAGEPVLKVLGTAGYVVAPAATSTPVVGTDYWAGVASSTSTNTASAAGIVNVVPVGYGVTYLVTPKTTATWATQALYDALVGSRVTADLTSSTYTVNATDGSTNGLVVQPLDVSRFPGKVRVAFRGGISFLA